jgi:hypothetical protein
LHWTVPIRAPGPARTMLADSFLIDRLAGLKPRRQIEMGHGLEGDKHPLIEHPDAIDCAAALDQRATIGVVEQNGRQEQKGGQ